MSLATEPTEQTRPQTLAGGQPHAEYTARLQQRQQALTAALKRLDRLGQARVAVFVLGLGLGWLAFVARLIHPLWLVGVVLALIGLSFYYDQTRRRRDRAKRAVRWYEQALARLTYRPCEQANLGLRFIRDDHPFAQDLDLFGPGSLFARLCLARTSMGEECLARALLEPASPAEIVERQAAVADLRDRLDLREDLALRGDELAHGVDFTPLAAWANLAHRLRPTWRLSAVRWLGLLNLGALGLLILGAISELPLVVSQWAVPVLGLSVLASLALTLPISRAVQAVLTPVEPMARDLALLAGLLYRLEREPFSAPLLQRLQRRLHATGQPPSAQMAELTRLVELLNSRRNQFFIPLAVLLLWNTRMALLLERWRLAHGPGIAAWLDAVGQFEMLSSLAAYAFDNPHDPFPQIEPGQPHFVAEGLAHPLLSPDRAVANDLSLGGTRRLIVVSGSNMSGKSTLLRSIGTNLVLALAGSVVRARRLCVSVLRPGATLRVQDSLQAGRSRFFAEITRIRQLLDLAQQGNLLFLLDEIFHGTNSHDRGIGAEAVLRRLLDAGAIGLVTTHDLALTQLADRLGPVAVNVHFADQFVDGQLAFDYQIRPGVVPHSNALALMRAVGIEV
jgi:hypothetical protein